MPTPTLIFHVRVPGRPVAKGRARVITRATGTGAYAYTPTRTTDAEELIQGYITAELLLRGMGDWKAQPGMAYRVELSFTFPVRKGVKGNQKCGTPHSQKPDLDNLVKLVLDAMKDWIDDAQIAESQAEKWWGLGEGTTVIKLYELGPR